MTGVRIYTTTYCAWCAAAKELLRSKRVYFEEIDVTGDLDGRDALASMSGGSQTVPQIFIAGQHIGGYRDLVRLDERGELDRLLALANPPAMAIQSS